MLQGRDENGALSSCSLLGLQWLAGGGCLRERKERGSKNLITNERRNTVSEERFLHSSHRTWSWEAARKTSHPAPLSPAESSRAPLGTVLQRLLEPSSEPPPLEDLILWQACSKTNHQAPTTFHTSVCSTCASSFLCSPSLPRGHHITWLPTHRPCYPLATHSRQHGHPTHWTHACICFCSDRSLNPEGPVSQFLPAGTLVILHFCHYPYPTAFPGPPEVKTNHSPFHVFTVFCIHHFALKFPIASLPATSETTSSWR